MTRFRFKILLSTVLFLAAVAAFAYDAHWAYLACIVACAGVSEL